MSSKKDQRRKVRKRMGNSRWDANTYTSYHSTRVAGKTREEVFQSRNIDPALDPCNIELRESRDSDKNPESTPIIIGLDVTGSMGLLAEALAGDLNTLVTAIYDRKPVTDPHICCMGIGDIECDQAPLQVTQFEADIRIAEQLTQIWIESGGGGNQHESYTLPWYFAIHKVVSDAWEKRQRKGYLFTVGDELPTPVLRKHHLEAKYGWQSANGEELLNLYDQVSEKWEVFHIIADHNARNRGGRLSKAWEEVLGQRAIVMSDPSKFTQIIVSAIEFNEGRDINEIAASWDDDGTSKVIASTFSGINFRR